MSECVVVSCLGCGAIGNVTPESAHGPDAWPLWDGLVAHCTHCDAWGHFRPDEGGGWVLAPTSDEGAAA